MGTSGLCTLLMCTAIWGWGVVFLYASPPKRPIKTWFREMCTGKHVCQANSLYARAVYKGNLFPLSELFLIFAVRSAPSRTGHRPGGEMVDTRDLKSLGPKRPCGFDSRPGHKNTLSRYLEGVFFITWQTFGKHRLLGALLSVPLNSSTEVWMILDFTCCCWASNWKVFQIFNYIWW